MEGRCGICGRRVRALLCREHRKRYRFIKRYNIYGLKPRRVVSKLQDRLYKTLRSILKIPIYQEVVFDFLSNHRYDIVVPDLKLIIEVNGEQHYKRSALFHKTRKDFDKQQEVDVLKRAIAIKRGYIFIDFSFKEDIGDKEYVKKKLILKGINIDG